MKKNSKSCLLNALFIISTIVLAMSIAVLFHWYCEGKQVQKDLQDIKTTQGYEEDKPTDKKDIPKIVNCVAWLEIPNTSIDFPVMQKKGDSEYYLRRNYRGEYSYSGTPFLDANCTIGTSQNLIVYGHNMKDGTMFSGLMNYKDSEYCKQNQTIEIIVDDMALEYKLYAVCKVASDDGWYSFTSKPSQITFDELISHIQNKAVYLSEDEAKYEDYFLTLSTCEYSQTNGRLIVIAKRK